MLIQKRWRGYFVRSKRTLSIADVLSSDDERHEISRRANSRKIPLSPSRKPTSSKSMWSRQDSGQSQRINLQEKVPFDKSKDIVLLIQSAVGLPPTTTVTRVHTKLYMPTKQVVSDATCYAISDLHSHHRSPTFDSKMRWKGAYCLSVGLSLSFFLSFL
jgi:hypothetical protein